MKQTAVEWLVYAVYRDMPYSELLGLLSDAKIIEKQQKGYSKEDLKQSFEESRKANIFEENKPPLYKDFEEWFNQLKDK